MKFIVSALIVFSSHAYSAKMDPTVLAAIRSTCTTAKGTWDEKTMQCYASKKEDAGAPCGKGNFGVLMFASNNAKYCCQAYDISKSGDRYSVHCDPQD